MSAVASAPLSVARGACLHCGQRAPGGESFCCLGCESVYTLLHREGLERYYELGQGTPQANRERSADHKWIEALPELNGWRTLGVQGVHCTACVWLFEQVFTQRAGALAIEVNPARGTLRIAANQDFDLTAFALDIERFGYRLGPQGRTEKRGDPLVLRMGICIALAMNAMIFAVAFYAGLSDGPLFHVFHWVELGLGVASVAIGGSYFVRAAWLGLRHRVLHLDLPIALGIVLAFASSLSAFLLNRQTTYFDTLTVFIALMLVGRWLQERVLRKNREELLANDGVESLLTRRVHEGGSVELVQCTTIEAGDRLLIAPSDLVPVEVTLDADGASCSLDWINGESAPRELRRGETIPAGAFNAGDRAFVGTSTQPFSASMVLELIRGGASRTPTRRWERFARIYVIAVLSVATLGFFGWWLIGGDVLRALEVTAGVLIITCPCAFGIATPLGYELVYAGLRRAGLFVQRPDFLDRAREIQHIVFDKTGTLTTSALEVEDPAVLDALMPTAQHVLYNLTARSGHPKSAAIARAMSASCTFDPALSAREIAGVGVELEHAGVRYRVGGVGEDVALFANDEELARIALREHLRSDAVHEARALRARGVTLWIASGDAPARVEPIANTLEIPADHAHGGLSPHDKAELVAGLDRALMIGDGINDSVALDRAFCSGTPAIDRPFLPARTDFYFTTAGLAPITLALRAARALGQVQRRNLRIAIAYNVLGVLLAWAGLLSPLVCAVLMPVSSLTVVSLTLASLSRRARLWST